MGGEKVKVRPRCSRLHRSTFRTTTFLLHLFSYSVYVNNWTFTSFTLLIRWDQNSFDVSKKTQLSLLLKGAEELFVVKFYSWYCKSPSLFYCRIKQNVMPLCYKPKLKCYPMLRKIVEGMIRASLGKLRLPNASPFRRRSSPQSIV